jgi:hypothetical protein
VVHEFPERLGFYRNFERILAAVDPSADWIALADQDDHWYPGKLETMAPALESHALVAGQARLLTCVAAQVPHRASSLIESCTALDR